MNDAIENEGSTVEECNIPIKVDHKSKGFPLQYQLSSHNFAGVGVLVNSVPKTDEYGTNVNLTGCSSWFAGSSFAHYLCDNLERFAGRNVLELGSGVGLTGCALSKAMDQGSHSLHKNRIILTDGEDEVVDVLRANCLLNGLRASTSCQQLWWGPCLALDLLKLEHPDGFDIIIGCDLFYNRSQEEAVTAAFHTVDALLSKAEGGIFFLSFSRRDLDIDRVRQIGADCGFFSLLNSECCYDIFGSNTDGLTDLWRDCTYEFTRMEGGIKEGQMCQQSNGPLS